MRKIITFCIALAAILTQLPETALAQFPQPVSWEQTVEKTADNTYEVKITASVDDNWYIYSQYMDEGGPFPTKFTFEENKQAALQDSVREEGDLIKKYEDAFMMETRYYKNKVTFVQEVKVNGKTPVTLNGKVSYMVCDPDQCLPPAEEKFSVRLD